ncbi:hypothetical protein NDU88_008474 [Pleurodeles waltl]|uniref:Uncharacterized protein n=1 Tax=Pleurodeles waltl TaxID=8319 RepID=A0AAV7PPE6_PLEWA|nr:hypothetical protein NDU88_008474 [Pleurodeles waltl]
MSSRERCLSQYRTPVQTDSMSSRERCLSQYRTPVQTDSMRSRERCLSQYRTPVQTDSMSSRERCLSQYRIQSRLTQCAAEQASPQPFSSVKVYEDKGPSSHGSSVTTVVRTQHSLRPRRRFETRHCFGVVSHPSLILTYLQRMLLF